MILALREYILVKVILDKTKRSVKEATIFEICPEKSYTQSLRSLNRSQFFNQVYQGLVEEIPELVPDQLNK